MVCRATLKRKQGEVVAVGKLLYSVSTPIHRVLIAQRDELLRDENVEPRKVVGHVSQYFSGHKLVVRRDAAHNSVGNGVLIFN